MTVHIKIGDPNLPPPPLKDTLQDSDGNAVDISGFNDITFIMEDEHDNQVVSGNTSGAVSATKPASGEVEYAWSAGDVDSTGMYFYEWRVENSDGTQEVYPRPSDSRVEVSDLG